MRLSTLAAALAASGAQSSVEMNTSPLIANSQAVAIFDPSPDFIGTVKIQGSNDDSSYSDLVTYTVGGSLINLVTDGVAGLAEGTDANTIKTTGAIDYRINGAMYTKAATDNIAMTACAAQADVKYCKYLVSIDDAGAVTVTKGNDAAAAADALLPATPADEAVIGWFQVLTGGATFTSGTDDLGGGSFTVTYEDLSFNTEPTVNAETGDQKFTQLTLYRYMRANATAITLGSVDAHLMIEG